MSKYDTFFTFLENAAEQGHEIRLVPMISKDGDVEFYAHHQDHDSNTFDGCLEPDALAVRLMTRGAQGRRGPYGFSHDGRDCSI